MIGLGLATGLVAVGCGLTTGLGFVTGRGLLVLPGLFPPWRGFCTGFVTGLAGFTPPGPSAGLVASPGAVGLVAGVVGLAVVVSAPEVGVLGDAAGSVVAVADGVVVLVGEMA